MKIPILVSGNPSSLPDGMSCKVYLHHGDWKLIVENLVDSQFSILDGAYKVLTNLIKGPTEILIRFDKQGNERNLNIYATDNA